MPNDLILPDFQQASVLVVGDVMLDRYWHGGTDRISPEAPVPVVHIQQREDRPGGAGNVALNISSLNGQAQLVGWRGDDEAGQLLEDKLQYAGVHCQLSIQPNYPTTTKLRVLSHGQQLIRLDFEDKTPMTNPKLHTQTQLDQQNIQAMVLSDYGKGALPTPQDWIQTARAHNIPVFVDPKGHCFERYQGAFMLTPNRKEFESVMGPCATEAELVERGHQALTQFNLQALLVTRGAEGMTLLQSNQPPCHLPALAQEVFDVTGAGDTVIATMALCVAAGCSLKQAMQLANLAASIAVAKTGTATVSFAELRSAWLQQQDVERGVLTPAQLSLAVEAAKARGETVVLTNGCFDILHPGHVDNLQKAKAFGDRLIVAVNSDASVKRLKGESRPINTLQHRMQVLTHLESVDWVVSFDEETPERLITLLSPDVLAKGGDYAVAEIAGSQHVLNQGGRVEIIPLVDGHSSSNVIQTIQDKASV